MPGLFLLLLSVSLFCVVFVFRCRKNQVITFLRPEGNVGDANQVDEEYNRRASIFLPINPLKINTFWFDSLATDRG